MDWKKWFEEVDLLVHKIEASEDGMVREYSTKTERMYQIFKARLMDELHLETEHGDSVIINTYADEEDTQS